MARFYGQSLGGRFRDGQCNAPVLPVQIQPLVIGGNGQGRNKIGGEQGILPQLIAVAVGGFVDTVDVIELEVRIYIGKPCQPVAGLVFFGTNFCPCIDLGIGNKFFRCHFALFQSIFQGVINPIHLDLNVLEAL